MIQYDNCSNTDRYIHPYINQQWITTSDTYFHLLLDKILQLDQINLWAESAVKQTNIMAKLSFVEVFIQNCTTYCQKPCGCCEVRRFGHKDLT